MLITNETDRITYLPQSQLFAWLESVYTDTLEWYANGNPHELTPAGLVAALESDNVDPLDMDQGHLEDHQVTPMWSELAYPLPHDADEMAHPFNWNTPSDIARESLRAYVDMFDIEALAERVLERLRATYDRENGNA